jgi:tripartite-type tricarboxylate transporter receptor subunit TctC
MTCVLLTSAVVLNMTHVPYRGAAQAMQDLLAGRTDFQCETVATALPHIQSNGVKAIALLAPERAEVLPNVPSVREQGLPNFDATGWLAFFLPKGTPAAIVNKLSQAAADAMDSPAVQERFRSIGLVVAQPYRRGPDFLTQFVKAEVEKWAVPIRASGVSVD